MGGQPCRSPRAAGNVAFVQDAQGHGVCEASARACGSRGCVRPRRPVGGPEGGCPEHRYVVLMPGSLMSLEVPPRLWLPGHHWSDPGCHHVSRRERREVVCPREGGAAVSPVRRPAAVRAPSAPAPRPPACPGPAPSAAHSLCVRRRWVSSTVGQRPGDRRPATLPRGVVLFCFCN